MHFFLVFRLPNLPLPLGRPEAVFNTVLLGTTEVCLPNGISFGPVALAGCTSVTDVTCRNRQHYLVTIYILAVSTCPLDGVLLPPAALAARCLRRLASLLEL